MSRVSLWHCFLVPIPVVGWLLLAAYLLDELRDEPSGSEHAEPFAAAAVAASDTGRRLGAATIDFGIVICCWALLPPAFGWLAGSAYLLFRDAGPHPLSVGKRLVSAGRAERRLTFVESFERNLPLLVPYLGPLVEATLVWSGRRRLGDRLLGRPRLGRFAN